MDPILVIGPGAVGGVLTARWLLAGQTVALLGRSGHGEMRLAERGFFYVEKGGRVRKIKGGIIAARRHRPPRCRAAYFCVKAADTSAAIRAARPFIGADTAVVSLQNGLGHSTRLRRAFGRQRTVIGTAYLAADRPGPGRFIHNGGRDILLANQGSNAAALALAARLLRQAGWNVRIKNNETRMLWTKLCFNAAINGIGALCAQPNGALVKDPALREVLKTVVREAVGISRRAGHPPLYRRMEALVARACRNAPRQRNSTLQDLQAGRRSEAPAIFGPLLAAAKKNGGPAASLTVIAETLRLLEQPRSA